MKTIEYYLSLPYKMELTPDSDEGGFVVAFPELSGCITCGETIDSAILNANDAKREWLVAAMEGGYAIPEPDNAAQYSGQFKLRIPKSLHKQLAEHSRKEGISMNQYCLYLLSHNAAANSIARWVE